MDKMWIEGETRALIVHIVNEPEEGDVKPHEPADLVSKYNVKFN